MTTAKTTGDVFSTEGVSSKQPKRAKGEPVLVIRGGDAQAIAIALKGAFFYEARGGDPKAIDGLRAFASAAHRWQYESAPSD